MPTNSEPVQFDQLPKEYDQRIAQRVMENSLRRVTSRTAEAPTQAPTVASKQDEDPLLWVL